MKQASIFAFGNRTSTVLAASAAVFFAAGAAATTASAATVAGISSVNVAGASIYNLYVSPTGSDSNTGTQAKPFKTINKAASVAKAGTTVHVAAGTYSGNVSTRTSGTPTNRIRYVSDTKWGAKIIGTGSEGMWTNNGNYVDITGFDITGTGRLGILNYASYTVMSNNHVHNLTVSGGCTGSGGAGIDNATYTGSNGDMIGNVIHDIGKPGSCNGIQGLYSSNNGGHIMNNIVYRVSAWGIQLWHASTNTIIANNTVFANGAGGMGGGIVTGVGDAPGGVQLTNTKVINNIVYANPASGIVQYCYSGQSCIGSGNVVSNNLVYGNGSAISMKVGSATGTISADPKFVSYNPTGTGDYRLQSGSPAVNKGTATSAPASDIVGVARPKGGAYDIGAYENY
jgi:parallel beta-helix repeat protein